MPGKIIPDAPPTPEQATPPPVNLPGGPIEAAAEKTLAATAEAAAAHATLANPAGMSGGAVEVHVPGAKMPTGADPKDPNPPPSFAKNYVDAVKVLDTLRTQGAGDALVSAPAEQVAPATQGGGIRATEDPESDELIVPGGAYRFHAKELAMGVKVEMEHTRDPRIALEIAKDHLAELPDYYTRLIRMEKRAFQERRRKTRRGKKAHRKRTEKKRSKK